MREVLETLLRAKGIVVAHTDTVWKALRLFRRAMRILPTA